MKLAILAMSIITTILGIDKAPVVEVTGQKQDNVILVSSKKYQAIRWDDLLSDEELAYYINEVELYTNDSTYQGGIPPKMGVNSTLNGKKIKIPGYPVAVDTVSGEYNKAKTFIFVPTAGACIHIPAPPENQTIFVEMKKAVTLDPYMPIYIEGTIYTEEGNNDIAEFFYKVQGDRIYDY